MTDEDVEKIIKRNMNLQMNLAGIRADFKEAQQRTWVDLPLEETDAIIDMFAGDPWTAVAEIQARLKDRNT
jgi:hypothetical protein